MHILLGQSRTSLGNWTPTQGENAHVVENAHVMGKSSSKEWGSIFDLEEYIKKAYERLKENIIVEEKLEKVPMLEA